MTPTEAELLANWTEEYFIPLEKVQGLRDKGAIILTEIPVDQWNDLKITGPGQAYVVCNLEKMKEAIGRKFLTQIKIDRINSGSNVCYVRSATEQEIRDTFKIDLRENPSQSV